MQVQSSINSIPDALTKRAVEPLFLADFNSVTNKLFSSAALAINTAGSPLVKTTVAAYGFAQGSLFTIAANTNMPALVGNVANAAFNVYVFLRSSLTGTVTATQGIAASTLGGVRFPPWNNKQVPIGFIIVNPTGTGPFVGGTTPLDDATVVPNVVYVNAIGSLDQTATIP